MRAMRVQRFRAHAAAGPRGSAIIAVPFDPDEAWGAKAEHQVNGTVNGCRSACGLRRPDVRAARIAEVVGLLSAGVKERPKS